MRWVSVCIPVLPSFLDVLSVCASCNECAYYDLTYLVFLLRYIALLHIFADAFAKNIFGFFMWHTLWRCAVLVSVAVSSRKLSRSRRSNSSNVAHFLEVSRASIRSCVCSSLRCHCRRSSRGSRSRSRSSGHNCCSSSSRCNRSNIAYPAAVIPAHFTLAPSDSHPNNSRLDLLDETNSCSVVLKFLPCFQCTCWQLKDAAFDRVTPMCTRTS